MKKTWILAAFAISVGCAQHHCRRPPDIATPVAVAPGAEETVSGGANKRRIKVYKYDGSLQCGQGKPISVEAMAQELKGIQVFSSQKRPDGLMHIQVCGSNSGVANIYEISEADLSKAEKKGFKKWTFE
ncbi:MAG: hypothetical protein AB7N80_12475 [Bdellovibrionales bacterium]